MQWFLMYLTDEDLTAALSKCCENLSIDAEKKKSGLIFIKENAYNYGKGFYVFNEDNSVIRSPKVFA